MITETSSRPDINHESGQLPPVNLRSEEFVKYEAENPDFWESVKPFVRLVDSANSKGAFESGQEIVIGNLKAKLLQSNEKSLVFRLELGESAFIMKFAKQRSMEHPLNWQMRQMQELEAEKGEALGKLGVVLPRMMFATPVVLLRRYEEGLPVTDKDFPVNEHGFFMPGSQGDKVELVVNSFLNKKREENGPLWRGTEPDFRTGNVFMRHNFIKREDGKVVLIDPFRRANY